MITIAHLAGVHIPGAPAEPAGDRVVQVNRQALALFNRIGLQPPNEGKFDLAELDAKLTQAGLTVSEKMTTKGHLRDAGLLPVGRFPDLTRR